MTVILDIDGVVYRGERPVGGSPEALQRLRQAGIPIVFATNNSMRTPVEVSERLDRIIGFEADPESIVTSSLAAASMLEQGDAPVFVLGSDAIGHAVTAAGLSITKDAEEAQSVVVGLDRGLTYERLRDAALAVRHGARYIATNIDPTFPVEGTLLPGSGSLVAAVSTASGRQPEVAGKPELPFRRLLHTRVSGECWVVGDRLDTDIALSREEPSWSSILVLTGVTTGDDDHSAADHVVEDMTAAVDLVMGVATGQ